MAATEHTTVLPTLHEFQALKREEQLWCLMEHGSSIRNGPRSCVYHVGTLMVVVQVAEYPLRVAGIQAYELPYMQ